MSAAVEVLGRLIVWYRTGFGFAHVPDLPVDVLVPRRALPPKARPRQGDWLRLRVRVNEQGRPVAASARRSF